MHRGIGNVGQDGGSDVPHVEGVGLESVHHKEDDFAVLPLLHLVFEVEVQELLLGRVEVGDPRQCTFLGKSCASLAKCSACSSRPSSKESCGPF